MFLEIIQIKLTRKNKEQRKLLKSVKRMKAGDEMRLHGFDMICFDKESYLLINATDGIIEKHYNQIKEWIINGGELD